MAREIFSKIYGQVIATLTQLRRLLNLTCDFVSNYKPSCGGQVFQHNAVGVCPDLSGPIQPFSWKNFSAMQVKA